MRTKPAATFFVILGTLLVVDWVLGAAQARGVIPLWVFLVPNFPMGLPYVWLESQWAGTAYMVNGQPVSEVYSFVLLLAAVVLQSILYWVLWEARLRRLVPLTAHR